MINANGMDVRGVGSRDSIILSHVTFVRPMRHDDAHKGRKIRAGPVTSPQREHGLMIFCSSSRSRSSLTQALH